MTNARYSKRLLVCGLGFAALWLLFRVAVPCLCVLHNDTYLELGGPPFSVREIGVASCSGTIYLLDRHWFVYPAPQSSLERTTWEIGRADMSKCVATVAGFSFGERRECGANQTIVTRQMSMPLWFPAILLLGARLWLRSRLSKGTLRHGTGFDLR